MFTAALPIAYAMTSDYREPAAVPLCPLRDIRYKINIHALRRCGAVSNRLNSSACEPMFSLP